MTNRLLADPLPRRHFLSRLSVLAAATAWSRPQGAENAVTSPLEIIPLFNGTDLSGWYPWLASTQYEDPLKVFTVSQGLLRVSGEMPGYLATTHAFRDYRLVVEYKWGRLTYGATGVRNSGVLLHATGPDGNHTPWMASIECQIAQGCVGDFIVIPGQDQDRRPIPVTITSDTEPGPDGRTRWKRNGKPTRYSGRQFWWSGHEAGFEEKIDTRGKNDVDSLFDEWTTLECICRSDRISVKVNGKEVNECYSVLPSAGKILIESEGFEILFRKIELHPLV